MKFYNDEEANQVADNFFKYYYKDRGKMKWQGFILSEQTAELKKFRKQQKEGNLDKVHLERTIYDQVKYGE